MIDKTILWAQGAEPSFSGFPCSCRRSFTLSRPQTRMSSPPDEKGVLMEDHDDITRAPVSRRSQGAVNLPTTPSGPFPSVRTLRALVRPAAIWISGIVFYALFSLGIVLLFTTLPSPAPASNSNSFSEERCALFYAALAFVSHLSFPFLTFYNISK